MEHKLTIPLHIGKEREGQYFELPFDVPEGVQRIDVSYSFERYRMIDGVRTEFNVIDLGLSSPNGFVGASGTSKSAIFVSEYASTDGYLRMKTTAGRWAIIIGAYKVCDEGVDVTFEIAFTPCKLSLYKGDTHVHTVGSDGGLSLQEVVQDAKGVGLDYIFFTDHNNYAHNYILPHDNDITIIPGVEWTLYKGHAGMLGVQRPIETYYANSQEEAEQKIQEAHDNGALVSINHPFCYSYGWSFGFDLEFDCIELVNNFINAGLNQRAAKWWQEQLCAGKKIPVIGGSDFHRVSFAEHVGCPTTNVYAPSRGQSDILAAIKAGHAYITFQPNAPVLFMQSGSSIMGDTISGGEIAIKIIGASSSDIVRVITKDGVREEYSPTKWEDVHTVTVTPDDIFCRVTLDKRLNEALDYFTVLYSNPIYVR